MPESTHAEPRSTTDRGPTRPADLYATLPMFKSEAPPTIPDSDEQISNHGLRIKTLIGAPAPESGPPGPYCVAWIPMPPNTATGSHVHWTTWTTVIAVATGPEGAITQGGAAMDEIIVQHPLEVVRIPPGKPHRAHNPSATHWVYVYEVRDCESPFDDRFLLPDLDSIELVMPSTSVVQHVTSTATVTDGRFG